MKTSTLMSSAKLGAALAVASGCAPDAVDTTLTDTGDSVACDPALPEDCGPRGGQSGTEENGETACDGTETRSVELDDVLEPLGLSLTELSARIGSTVLPGLWLSTGTHSELSLELGPLTSAREELGVTRDGTICLWTLELESVTIRTSDGAIDARVPARIDRFDPNGGRSAVLEVSIPALAEDYSGPAIWPPDVSWARQWLMARNFGPNGSATPSLAMSLLLAESPLVQRAAALQGDEILGVWAMESSELPSGPPTPFTVSETLASACDGAEQFQNDVSAHTPFTDAGAALEAMSGTWARCLDHAASEHDGLQIMPDGSWHHVTLEDGELVSRFGFGHEGFLQLIDTSSMNGTAGLFQVNLQPFGRRYGSNRTSIDDFMTRASDRALVFGSQFEGWPAAVYLPTTAPVRTAPPEYADGERAGIAACSHGERGIVATFDDTAAALTGDYVLCSGALADGVARIRFEGTSITLMREDGSVLPEHSYETDTMNAPRVSLQVTGGAYRWWLVAVSRWPRKVWIGEAGEFDSNVAVFSAEP